jgi:hypothetical protein
MLGFRALTTVSQGTVGLGLAIGYFTRKGYVVSLPLNDNQGYDLIIDDGQLNRVQVKTTRARTKNGRHYKVLLKSVRHNKTVNRVHLFDKTSVEYLFVVVEDERQYLIPSGDVGVLNTLTLDERFEKFKVE